MKPNSDPIRRLFGLAREAPRAELPAELPYGFTTRVLARLNESLPESPWERLALGALPVGGAMACRTKRDWMVMTESRPRASVRGTSRQQLGDKKREQGLMVGNGMDSPRD